MSRHNGEGFFSRMRNSDKPGFEIAMFSVSIAVALFVIVAVGMVAYYYIKGQASHFTDKEVNAGSVTGEAAAVEVDTEDSEPVETLPPDGNMIINEDNVFDADEELKDATEAYTSSAVNLRAEDSLTSSVLTKIPFGELVQMVEYDGGEWAKVSYNGMEGYVSAMYLSVTKPLPPVVIDDAPRTTTAPTTETPKPTKKPKPTKEPEETEEPMFTEEPIFTEEPVETETPPTEAPTEAPPEPTEPPAPPTEPPAPPTEPPAEPTTPPAEQPQA